MMPSPVLHAIAIVLYAMLAVLLRPGGPLCCKPTPWSRWLPLAPLTLHGYLLAQAVLLDGGISLGFAASVSAMAALTVLVYFVAAWFYPLAGLQSFVFAFAGVAMLMQWGMPHPHILPLSGTPGFRLHLLMAFTAYGLLTVAALHAVLIALVEKHLHKPVPPRIVSGLPPLLTLENLLFRVIDIGFVILTLTLASGMLFSEQVYGRPFPFTHMTVFGIASWLIFGALLAGRRIRGWRGRTAIYWTLAGFTSLLLAYVGVKFVLEVLLGRS